MLIDTHTHLYLDEFAPNPSDTVNRALEAGVRQMIFPNVDLDTVAPMRALAALFRGNVSMAMGLHPTSVGDNWRKDLETIEDELHRHRNDYVAVGEIGIDLYWDKTYKQQQIEVFRHQIRVAADEQLPIIIHCRDGLYETLEVLRQAKTVPAGVFHSFGGTKEDVERIRQVGDFYFGINGIVTFKNSSLRDVLPIIGLDRILLETDSPYLAPVPFRGRRNESAYIKHIAAYIASVLDVGIETVEKVTSKNAAKLFKLNQASN